MNEHAYTNELITESSPYLLEHAHNPVNWYPWGKKALEKAKNENKPLIISIGYAACHWCHVMERESYSDERVADFMNKHFVAIKIDREERPDIDKIYMDAAMLISGTGGWPLNALALPDGRPFYVITYLPKEDWLDLLEQVHKLYSSEPDKIKDQAENLTREMNQQEFKTNKKDGSNSYPEQLYKDIFPAWEPLIDFELGGYNRAPKFPLPAGWEFLLQYYYITKNERALQAVTITLKKMALGGIYDQLGGGFARYATDANWKIPHFEKMLYDNGQLVSLYSHAYQLTKNPLYEDITRDILNFIRREMTIPEGGFYSSLNADSVGEEGKFYVFTKSEIYNILPLKLANTVCEFYQVTESGNWENGKNILFPAELKQEFALRKGIAPPNFNEILRQAKSLLFDARSKKVRPSTDDKILTSWNAIMLKGYIDAYRSLGDEVYLSTALRNARFLRQNMVMDDGRIWRNYKNGKSMIPGFLDDYALLSQAYIDLYQVTFDIQWLLDAKKLTDYAVSHFIDKKTGMFFYTSDESEDLILRKIEVTDNVMPSSNAIMAKNLFLLGEYFFNQVYTDMSKAMVNNVLKDITTGGPYYANWAFLLGVFTFSAFEIAITGNDAIKKNRRMQQPFMPLSIFMGGKEENLPLLENKIQKDKTMIYICKDKTCSIPVEDIKTALGMIKINP